MEVTYITHSGTDLTVVNAARVSFNKESKWDPDTLTLGEKDKRLIGYLVKHGHHSPFNHCFITMRVKAPMFVARQLQKHEYMPWNEVSRRYVDTDPEFFSPKVWRGRPTDKKQGSEGVVDLPYHSNVDTFFSDAKDYYEYLLALGIAPEQARMVLPMSTYTEWYWSGTLHAWSKMYNLRTSDDAQKETMDIALKCGEIIERLFPVSWKELT